MRYYSLSTYMRQRYGCRVQKIPLDAGSTCPNRDGTISAAGCVFCNPFGSGSGMGRAGKSLAEQWELWRHRLHKRYGSVRFWAYLQSFSNTYGPVGRLRQILDSLHRLPEMAGLCIGTRPDCLEQEKLNLIRSYDIPETWIELGLQSASEGTLRAINRGHDVSTFVRAVERASEKGLKICVHVIAGLPGEEEKEFRATVDFINTVPVHGIKFHNLYVCKGSSLAASWAQGDYLPLERDQYVRWMHNALIRLRPDIVVQRLNADPQPEELLAPEWALQKSDLIRSIRQDLEKTNTWQGQESFCPHERPSWFSPQSPPPATLRSRS